MNFCCSFLVSERGLECRLNIFGKCVDDCSQQAESRMCGEEEEDEKKRETSDLYGGTVETQEKRSGEPQ